MVISGSLPNGDHVHVFDCGLKYAMRLMLRSFERGTHYDVKNPYTREEVKAGAKSGVPVRDAAPSGLPWKRTITPNSVMLFRYSAITFNPHRIHYDKPYCMEVEGYPGLVVHGPFAQQCLFDLLRDSMPGRRIKTFTVRARAPLFDTAPFDVVGRPTADGKGAELWTVTPKGTIAAQATATLD